MDLTHVNFSILVTLIIVLFLFFNALLRSLKKKAPKNEVLEFMVDGLSAPALVCLSLFVLNKSGHRIPYVNPILVDVPVVEGIYVGEVHTVEDSGMKKFIVHVEITQSATNVIFDLRSNTGSHSTSKIAHLIERNGNWSLEMIYENEKTTDVTNPNRYTGYCKMEIFKDSIAGSFYNDYQRKTSGSIFLKKIGNPT